MDSRRRFLRGVLVAGVATVLGGGAPGRQVPVHPKQTPADAAQDAAKDNPSLPSPEKRMLDENVKDIKKKVQRLYELATDLKAEVDKTDSSKVLNTNLIRKAEEIEKLAREIKNRSKGS